MDIDYNKLRNFLAVVDSGGITAAAKTLNRTQSAVSQSINHLEQTLGVKLIEWEGKRLKLTREGQLIYKALHSRMIAIEERLTTIIQTGKEIKGSIEIGVLQDHSTMIQQHLFQILSQFRKKYPAVTFKINFATSSEIEQALLDQLLDIGLLINFRERHRFRVFEVATEEHIVASSTEYLQQLAVPESLQKILEANLIDINEEFTCFTPWVRKHAPELLHQLEEKIPVIVVPDFKAAKELVLLNQGIAILPRYLIEKELTDGLIVRLFPHLSTLRVGLDCAIVEGRKERLHESLFIEALRESLFTK